MCLARLCAVWTPNVSATTACNRPLAKMCVQLCMLPAMPPPARCVLSAAQLTESLYLPNLSGPTYRSQAGANATYCPPLYETVFITGYPVRALWSPVGQF
jgi:hypothetical protein